MSTLTSHNPSSPTDEPTKEANTTLSPTPSSSLSSVQSEVEKTAYRKADIRLLLWYSFVYLIMRIHVQNITNSAIMNLETGHGIKAQLGGLDSEQWAWVISIFYYPYMFLEPPATLLLKRFSPSKWMARIMITWGIISMCQGATQSYAGLLACRFFLGAAEAGFYPGVLYHLSFWYPSDQMALRIAFFYACGMFSGTISGLLAYGISFMNGVGGLAGWRWMFILFVSSHSPLAKYLVISVAVACSICVYPALWPERIRAAHGTTTAGLAIGMTNASAQLMGIVGPQVYQSRFGPEYKISYATSIGLLVGAVGMIAGTWVIIRRRGRGGGVDVERK